MRWAFVIQLASDTNPAQRHFAGRIEEVDSARELRFRSTEELLIFLGECFTRSGHSRGSDITSEVIDTANGGHVKGMTCSNE